MSGKLVPALIAGVATFIISFILGFIPFVSCCACLMPLVGGFFAVFLYSNNADFLDPKTGASVGLIAAVVHFVMSLVIQPIVILIRWNAMQAEWARAMEEFRRNGMPVEGTMVIVAIIVVVIVAIALIFGLYAVGGLIGGSVFKKGGSAQKPFEPPMPPASYGV